VHGHEGAVSGALDGKHPVQRDPGRSDDQKFGLSLTDGSAHHAIARILDQPRLELVGLHCHLGSQITSAKPYLAAVRRMVGLLARVRDQHGVTLPELDLGGGHGIAYRPGEPVLDIAALGPRLRAELADSCAAAGLPVPRLIVEPGRAVVGPAGVALYRVLAVKRTGHRTFVAVDGGMSDNPRPALYGVRYAPRLVGRATTAPPTTTTVAGRHCEAGDVLAGEAELPGDIRPGDLLAVPVAGVAGAVLPGCECASVPVAGALVRRGVTPAAALAFLLSAPAINPIVLTATAVAFPRQPQMVFARFVASLFVACAMGWLCLFYTSPSPR
ncbi:permease, partial [Streptomyces albiflaviniger]|nr:permease [Streptomyces albiflaviniger]